MAREPKPWWHNTYRIARVQAPHKLDAAGQPLKYALHHRTSAATFETFFYPTRKDAVRHAAREGWMKF